MTVLKRSHDRRPVGLVGILVAATAIWVVLIAAVAAIATATGGDRAILVLGQQTVRVELSDFEITPNVIEVEPHIDLSLAVENVSDTQHDLTISEELTTGRLKLGEQSTLDVGVVSRELVIWCAIKGHREQGMEARIRVVQP